MLSTMDKVERVERYRLIATIIKGQFNTYCNEGKGLKAGRVLAKCNAIAGKGK